MENYSIDDALVDNFALKARRISVREHSQIYDDIMSAGHHHECVELLSCRDGKSSERPQS